MALTMLRRSGGQSPKPQTFRNHWLLWPDTSGATPILLWAVFSSAGQAASLDAQEKSPDTPASSDEAVVKLEKYVAEEDEREQLHHLQQADAHRVRFDKPLMDTPRAITVVTSEMLDIAAIRNAEDLVKVAPSHSPIFRFGLPGNYLDPHQTSDFYFRGMKASRSAGQFPAPFFTAMTAF